MRRMGVLFVAISVSAVAGGQDKAVVDKLGVENPLADVVELLEDDAEFIIENVTCFGLDEGSVLQRSDKTRYSGVCSVSVTAFQSMRVDMPSWNYQIVEHPGSGQYRYLRFAWKRTVGPGIMLQLYATSETWHRYYAGTVSEDTRAWGPMTRIAREPPRRWEMVTRDLFKDFGALTISGISLTPMEGDGHAYFDHIYLGRTIEDLDRITLLRKNVVEGPIGTEPFNGSFWLDILMGAGATLLFLVFIYLCRSRPGCQNDGSLKEGRFLAS